MSKTPRKLNDVKPKRSPRFRHYTLGGTVLTVSYFYLGLPSVIHSCGIPLPGAYLLGASLPLVLLIYPLAYRVAGWLRKYSSAIKETFAASRTLLTVKKDRMPYSGPRPKLTLAYEISTGREIVWDNRQMVTHALVTGTTGKGKSSFLFSLLYQQCLRGGGAIVIDGGKNIETLKKLIWICKRSGRITDLRIVDPRTPKHGHTYNPLASDDADVIANKIQNILNPTPVGSDSEYYSNRIYHATLILVRALHQLGKSFSFRDILSLFDSPEISIKILKDELRQTGLYESLTEVQNLIGESKNVQGFKDVVSNMIANLSSVATSQKGDFLCASSTDISLYEAVKKGQIIYIMLPRMNDAARAERLGRVFLADIQATIGVFYEQKNFKPLIPFLIVLDEFGSYATPNFSVVFEQARKANFSVVAAIQSFGNLCDPELGLSQAFAQKILGNTDTKIYFAARDYDTAYAAACLAGQEKSLMKTASLSSGSGDRGELISLGRLFNPQRDERTGTSRGFSEQYDFKVRPEVFMHDLNRPQGSIIIDSGTGEPILARAVWANPQIPPDWNYEDDIPRFKPKQVAPLGLYERVYLQRYEKATTADSETGPGEGEGKKENTSEANGEKSSETDL